MPKNDLARDLLEEHKQYERLFCGCAFINPRAALDKCAWLEKDDFYDTELADYWGKLKEHGDPIKASTDSHTTIRISKASTELTTSLFPESYASEIKRLSYLARAADKIAELAMSIHERDEQAVRDKVAYLHNQAQQLGDFGADNAITTPAQINTEFIQRIKTQSPSLLTGIEDLDNILGGLFMGELTIMAGRPGIGKTSVATAIAQNIATNNNDAKVLFFSLEMDKIQLWARMACAKTMYSWKDIRSGRADKFAIEAVEKASQKLEQELAERLIIEDSIWDVPTIINKCANLHPSLVVIDHLSEIRWKDDNAEEVKWFGRATKLLRTEIARRMHIPVILLHQLNRGVEGRDKKRPVLSDLKWSGDLEAIADTVIMLYREDYYDDDNAQKSVVVPMEIWIRKNRQGVMNSCAIVNFDTRTQKFTPARAPAGNPVYPALNVSKVRMPAIDNTEHMWYNQEHET